MAWVSAKVYAILSKSEEGKDIIERLPDMSDEERDEAVDEFFSNTGKGASFGNDYQKAREDDEFEEQVYRNADTDYSKDLDEDKQEDLPNHLKDADYQEGHDYELDGLRERDEQGLNNDGPSEDDYKQEIIENAKEDWVKTPEDEELWNSLSDENKYLLAMSNDMGFWFDEISDNEDFKKQYDEISSKFSINQPKKSFNEGSKKSKSKDYTSVKNQKSRLSSIIGDVSHYTSDKSYDVLDFRDTLEKNGFKIDYIENKSGTWQDRNGEKHKEYDIKLDDGTHIYFDLVADENYDTKEVIAYTNGKGW